MKKRLLPSICLLILAITHPCYSQVFVKHDAAGANNGTSWADAYTDLKTALSAAAPGSEIWVAAGTYKPDVPNGDPASTFLINKNLRLLGGFNGMETAAGQRNPQTNLTILSGDLNEDDVDDNFVSFKSDNVMTVVTINANITNETLIDGFTIEGGQADGVAGGADKNGGGIYSNGAPVIRYCTITQNFSTISGGGIFIAGTNANGIKMESCQFLKNRSQLKGGAVFVNGLKGAGLVVSQCEFTGNKAISPVGTTKTLGGGISTESSNLIVANSTFNENISEDWGGAIQFFAAADSVSVELSECEFSKNESKSGAGFDFSVNDQQVRHGNRILVSKCNFSGNKSVAGNPGGFPHGGAIYAFYRNAVGGLVNIDSCDFTNNSTIGNGSAIGIDWAGSSGDFSMANSNFIGNSAKDYYATVFIWNVVFSASNHGAGSVVVKNCLFENNTSKYSAGLDIGDDSSGGVEYAVSDCLFKQNYASSYSGGLTLYSNVGSASSFDVESCNFENNTANAAAGAVWLVVSSNDFQGKMHNCKLENNQSPKKGSAIAAFLFEATSNLPTGAVFSVENSLIANNTGNSAISLDSFPGLGLLNCTIADNHGGIKLANQSGLTLQNTILYNPGFTDYTTATDNVTFTSLGGNLIGDSLSVQLQPSDKQELDPLFVVGGDYHLTAGSPCIDSGINDGVSAQFDLDGNPRMVNGVVDIGAYESMFTPAREVLWLGEASVSPNPAGDFLTIQLSENTSKVSDVQVFDTQGRLVLHANKQQLDVQGLATGMYSLRVVSGERVFSGKFIKQ